MTQNSQDVTTTGIRMHLALKQRSQTWLASEIGESSHWVSRRMSGKVKLNLEDIDRIASALSTDLLGILEMADGVDVTGRTSCEEAA